MPPVGFQLTISAGERPQTYALDRAATGTGDVILYQDTKFCTILGIFPASRILRWYLDSWEICGIFPSILLLPYFFNPTVGMKVCLL